MGVQLGLADHAPYAYHAGLSMGRCLPQGRNLAQDALSRSPRVEHVEGHEDSTWEGHVRITGWTEKRTKSYVGRKTALFSPRSSEGTHSLCSE